MVTQEEYEEFTVQLKYSKDQLIRFSDVQLVSALYSFLRDNPQDSDLPGVSDRFYELVDEVVERWAPMATLVYRTENSEPDEVEQELDTFMDARQKRRLAHAC